MVTGDTAVRALAAVLGLLLTSGTVLATKYADPKRHRVYSANDQFFLDVNPETQVHVMYAVASPTSPLWSFSRPVWHEPILVASDGATVAIVPWMHVSVESLRNSASIDFWSARGRFRSQQLDGLCPRPELTEGRGPIGPDWRTWLLEIQDHGDSFTVVTTCDMSFELRFADGNIIARSASRRVVTALWLGGISVSMVLSLLLMRRLSKRGRLA